MEKTNPYAIAGAGLLGAGLMAAIMIVAGGDNDAAALRTEAGRAAAAQSELPAEAGAELVSSAEAEAWAQARAADSADAYKVYLAAYPTGAFRTDAIDALAETRPAPVRRASAPAPVRVQTVSTDAAPVLRGPSLAARCRDAVDAALSAPSRTYRTAGGAAAGCAVGALAGGDDGRNCLVGAIAGGAAGAISAESRVRRREREIEACIAAGGPG